MKGGVSHRPINQFTALGLRLTILKHTVDAINPALPHKKKYAHRILRVQSFEVRVVGPSRKAWPAK